METSAAVSLLLLYFAITRKQTSLGDHRDHCQQDFKGIEGFRRNGLQRVMRKFVEMGILNSFPEVLSSCLGADESIPFKHAQSITQYDSTKLLIKFKLLKPLDILQLERLRIMESDFILKKGSFDRILKRRTSLCFKSLDVLASFLLF